MAAIAVGAIAAGACLTACLKRRISTLLSANLSLAFIAISGGAAQVILDRAKQIIAAAAGHASTKAEAAGIAIVDDGGNLFSLGLLENTFLHLTAKVR